MTAQSEGGRIRSPWACPKAPTLFTAYRHYGGRICDADSEVACEAKAISFGYLTDEFYILEGTLP